MNYLKSFYLLLQEGYLFRSSLTTGLTELRAAQVHNRGAFYSALFNLSIGFERLLKSCVIIEHMLTHNLTVPTVRQLKAYGHNISDLHSKAHAIGDKYNISVPELKDYDSPTQEIFTLLSDLAQSSRYYNLNALSDSESGQDPLEHWNDILFDILSTDVSERQIFKILAQAGAIAEALKGKSSTIMNGLDRKMLTTEEAFALPGLHGSATKHAVFRVVQVLDSLRNLIRHLSYQAYGAGGAPPFPQMQEFLEWLWNDRAHILRKKCP